jgi:uracil-DNA glycosylase family 4
MGFLSETSWSKQRQPLSLLPLCGECGLDRACRTPKMRVDGNGKRKVMIVCEGPGENEDRIGRPLVGLAGQELVQLCYDIGVNLRDDCWLTNAIICRATTPDGKNRAPTGDEVSFCQPNLINNIKHYRPNVIIPMGIHAVKSVCSYAWKDDATEYDNMARWHGWQIPSIKLNAWICPTYHPSFVLQAKERNKAAPLIVREALRAAFGIKRKPYDELPDYTKYVQRIYEAPAAAALIRSFISDKPVAFDYENSPLKPDVDDAHVFCASLSDGERTISFPWVGEAITAMREFLVSQTPKIAANIQHEERWTWKLFGHGVTSWYWDTVVGAHWRNCHAGVCGLKFQVFALFGVPFYASHLEALMQGENNVSGKNSHNRLSKADRDDLLLYCGCDSLFEVMVAQSQMTEGGLL